MRFIAKRPKEGINVSDTHPLLEAGTLVVGLAAIFAVIAIALVFLVEVALYFVSAEDEAGLFGEWLPDDIVTVAGGDPRSNDTQLLVDRLAMHWPDSPYQFRVEIDTSEIANAMAFPGGLIIVTQGVLDQVESENELAFVLAHEIGHFRNRDHLRAMGRGITLSLVFAAVFRSDAAGIGIKAADVTLRSFSRSQETAADEFALAAVYAEYGHVNQAWRLFERWEIDDHGSIEFVSYLSTHPDTGERIDDMKQLASANGWKLEGSTVPLEWKKAPLPVDNGAQ